MVASRFRRLLEAVEAIVGGACIAPALVMLPLLIGVSVYDIIGRQFYNTGSTRLQELEWHLFFGLVLASIGYAYLRDAHVRIDVFRDRASDRTKAKVEALGYVFALVPFCLVVIVYGGQLAWLAYVADERSRAALGLPMRWIIKSALPLGGLLLLLAGTTVFARNALFLLGREPRPAPAGREA
jgi:TRAP-type mannitol/chloroaromatic compound transport system permease small subunit